MYLLLKMNFAIVFFHIILNINQSFSMLLLYSSECAHLFHKAGARLILCGSTWDKLESLYDSLITDSDPREVRK